MALLISFLIQNDSETCNGTDVQRLWLRIEFRILSIFQLVTIASLMDVIQQAQEKTNMYIIRTIGVFGGMTHWTWYFYYTSNFQNIHEFLWPRLLLSALSFAVLVYSFRPNAYKKTLSAYNTGLFIFFLYEAFLYLYNAGDQHYSFSLFGMGVLTMSAVMNLGISIAISVITVLVPLAGYIAGVPLDIQTVMHWTIASPPIFLVVGFLLYRNVKHKNDVINLHVKYVEISKNSAVGEMSSGMAHEINNPLTIITGRLNLLIHALNKKENIDLHKVEHDVLAIKTAAHRIERVIKSLRLYTEKLNGDDKETLQVQSIFDHALDMCNERLKNAGVDFRVDIPQNSYVHGNQAMLAQVFLTLILNSIEAIENIHFKFIRVTAHETEKGVLIQVYDSGPRIPDEIRKKMMNPFFTTKDPGKVSGLGLNTSKSIIELHGGRLTLANTDETCFQIFLPKVQAPQNLPKAS